MDTTRRRLLGAAATAAVPLLAGCGALGRVRRDGTLAVRVNNRTDRGRTVTVTVTGPDGTVRDRTVDAEVPASTSRAFESSGYGPGRYAIRVEGDRWATSSLWDPAICSEYVSTTTLDGAGDTPSVTVAATCASDA